MPTQFDTGFLVGLLVGEGHFGGDGRQAQPSDSTTVLMILSANVWRRASHSGNR